MFSTVLTAALHGMNVEIIHVEADVSNGLPTFHMVGYLSSEVKEAGDRVRTAIRNMGFKIPPKKIVINLSPANVRKTGTSFDLPIAVAVLSALGLIHEKNLDSILFIGEIGLNGSIQNVPGILPIVLKAKEEGCHTCIVPRGNAREGSFVQGICIIGVESIAEVIAYFELHHICASSNPVSEEFFIQKSDYMLDYSDIQGQEAVKRATEVAVAGQHHLLMIGPPGSGKSMIAQRIPTILPPLSREESMEVSKIYSIMGLLKEQQPIVGTRPFRSVHHTVTKAALIGGGMIPKPGEISMANEGVLFLDELPEFKKQVLEVLRQPIEECEIRISRNRGIYVFPANIMIVSAMNPCPCGNYPDLNRCSCKETEIKNYLGKVSQPFLDRLDICVEVPRVAYSNLKNRDLSESSKTIRERICSARNIQAHRYKEESIHTNAKLSVNNLNQYCRLDEAGETLMNQAFTKLHLTARTYHKVLRVARTIADLDCQEQITITHLREAIGYRVIDKKYWRR